MRELEVKVDAVVEALYVLLKIEWSKTSYGNEGRFDLLSRAMKALSEVRA